MGNASSTPPLARLWHEYNEAIQAKDRRRLLEMLHPDFVGIDPKGVARGRSEYIDFCDANLPADLGIEFIEVTADTASADVVVITATQRMGPHPFASAADRYMTVNMISVWVKTGDHWCLRWQQGMIPA